MDKGRHYPEGSIYRIDYFALLLCMAVAHLVIGNPFFGAAVYLFANIVKAFLLCNLARLRHRGGNHYFSSLLMALVAVCGMAVAFLYPPLMGRPDANYVSLFVISLMFRDYLCSSPVHADEHKASRWVYLSFVQLCFDAVCIYMLYGRVADQYLLPFSAVVVLTGLIKLAFPEKNVRVDGVLENKYEELASYRLFEDMSLYSTIALNVGVMVFFLFVLFPVGPGFDRKVYLGLCVWLMGIYLVLLVSSVLLKRRLPGLALAEFILGALTWILGAVLMFREAGLVERMVWTSVWGMGMALIFSAVRKFHLDFEAVGSISDDGLDRTSLEISNTITATVASIVSSGIMLLLMAVYAFVLPLKPGMERVGIWTLQIPVAFMLVALFFAFRQPLDYRNREKLMKFIESRSKTGQMRENLRSLFVSKYRMRFGVKILCTLAKPFFRLKVSGRDNLRREDYPSVFVCNHGFIYGPISAVIYLPTYFRPWIHNVMLDKQTAYREMSKSLAFLKRVMGKRLGGWFIWQLTRATCWALNSCNPIPVVRGASRDVMSTFKESLEALEDGDNILIFPEKPRNLLKAVPDSEYKADNVRTFYTGFAHIGKMYFDRTGKSLLFYPLFSDRATRSFRIGKPVAYDSSLEPHESKRVLAEQLQDGMEDLISHSGL